MEHPFLQFPDVCSLIPLFNYGIALLLALVNSEC